MEFVIWGLLPTGFYEYITTSYNYSEVEDIIGENRMLGTYVNYYVSGENEYVKEYLSGGVINGNI